MLTSVLLIKMETSSTPNYKRMVILITKNYPAIKIMVRENF